MRLELVVATALALGVVSATPTAFAQQPPPTEDESQKSVPVDIVVLHGTNDGTGIDPKIGNLPGLSKPPFSAYNSYKLLDRPRLALPPAQPKEVTLPNGRILRVTYKGVVAQKDPKQPPKHIVSLTISKLGAKKGDSKKESDLYMPLLEVNAKTGEWFFVAGQAYKGGMLVIGIQLPAA